MGCHFPRLPNTVVKYIVDWSATDMDPVVARQSQIKYFCPTIIERESAFPSDGGELSITQRASDSNIIKNWCRGPSKKSKLELYAFVAKTSEPARTV